MAHRILVVDDDPAICRFLDDFLRGRLGYQVQAALTGQDGLDLAVKQPFDLCILDVDLPDISGPEIYMRLKNQMPDTEAIFFTGLKDFQKTQEFLRFSLPQERVISKPMKDTTILTRMIVEILGPPKP